MFTKIARIFTYISIAAPLIASKSLFFPFITGKNIFFRVFIELALVALAGALAYGEIPLATLKNTVKKPIFIAISVFTALFTLSAFTAQAPSFAFWSNFERGEGAWQMIHYFLLFLLILVLFQGKSAWKRLISFQAVIGALVALYAVGQAINWPSWIIDPPMMGASLSGTLGNPAYMGIYMILNACFAVWLALQNSGIKQYIWLFIASFETFLFFIAQNRGSFVAVGVGTILMLVIWLIQKKRSKKSYIGAGILAFFIIFGIGTLIFTVKGGDAIKGLQPRLWTWESAIAGVIERPLLGWGPENFPFIFDAYYNPKHYTIESWFDRAHNTPLEYLTIGGIPLFLAYSALFIVLYMRLFRKKNEELFPFFAVLPLMYVINGLALFETLPLYLILFLLIAFITAYTEDFKEISAPPQIQYQSPTSIIAVKQGLFILLALGVGISLYTTAYRPLQKNLMMLEAMRTNNKNDIELFQEHENILRYSSPVGNEEALQGLLTFTVSYFDYLKKNNLGKQIPKEKLDNIMKFEDEWYAKQGPYAIGVKSLHIRATGLLAAYEQSKDGGYPDMKYVQEADNLIAKGAKIAPTRIEFIRLAMVSAVLRNDNDAYAKALKKGKELLPNFAWDTIVFKSASTKKEKPAR